MSNQKNYFKKYKLKPLYKSYCEITMQVISYESFVDLFQPIEIDGEMLISDYPSNQTQRQSILDAPDEFVWVKETNKLYPHGKNPNEERITHYLITQLSHQNELIEVDLIKNPENFNHPKTYEKEVNHGEVTDLIDSSATTKNSDILNAHIESDNQSLEIYFKNISRRWKKEIDLAEKIIILSPYITSSTAETVTKDTQGNNCVIYTLFSAELFINQSSSIKTLIKLKKNGFKLYALKDLHAKIVFIPGKFASIGSQNLTTNGTKNKEATVIIKNKTHLEEIERSITEWVKDSYEITLEKLEEMQKLVKPFLDDYIKIIKVSEKIDKEIEKISLVKQDHEKTLKKFKKEAEKSTYSTFDKNCRITWKGESGWYGSGNWTLFCLDSNPDLMNWYCYGINESLRENKNHRYTCLIKNTGKIGFGRLVKTRMTQFNNSVGKADLLEINNHGFKVFLTAIWNIEELKKSNNLFICLYPTHKNDRNYCIVCKVWFHIRGLYINEVKVLPYEMSYAKESELTKNMKENKFEQSEGLKRKIKETIDWITENETEFNNMIIPILLKPFQFEKNLFKKADAYNFFGGEKDINLSLGKLDGNPFFIAEY